MTKRVERVGERERKRERESMRVACGPRAPLFWHDDGSARFAAAVKNRYSRLHNVDT